MGPQTITIRTEGLSIGEQQILCDECAVQRRSSASLLSSSSLPGAAVDAGMRYCGVPSGNPPKRVSRGDANACNGGQGVLDQRSNGRNQASPRARGRREVG